MSGKPLAIVRTVAALRAQVAAWRKAGERVALIPTMGALHAGHLSLIALGRERAERTVASIFVNPTQFAPHEDFEAYPREESKDIARLNEAGCDLLFAPSVEEMYAPGFSTRITVEGVSASMDGAARPHHFGGVATIVAKLLIQCGPDVAIFGEKDYQQLQVIRRLARDLDLPVEIVGGATVRGPDGLALSSRNAYLSAAEHVTAAKLNLILKAAIERLQGGAAVSDVEAEGLKALESAGFSPVDYLEVRDPDDLSRLGPGPLTGPGRILAAAKIGRTRLIDNMAV
jgi:pantoate--beta-alanine ligase